MLNNNPLTGCFLSGQDELSNTEQNIREYTRRFLSLFNQSVTMFKYTGLPETCDTLYLERLLVATGTAGMVDTGTGVIIEGLAGPVDVNPSGRWLTAQGYNCIGKTETRHLFIPGMDKVKELLETPGGRSVPDIFDTVQCYANPLLVPDLPYIKATATRVADGFRALDTIRTGLKKPCVFIVPDQKLAKSLSDIYEETKDNKGLILASKGIDPELIKTLTTGVSGENLKSIEEYIKFTLNDYYNYKGIQTSDEFDKKERLIVAEAEGNQAVTNSQAEVQLACRKKFIETCNNVFGEKYGFSATVELVTKKEGEEIDKHSDETDSVQDK